MRTSTQREKPSRSTKWTKGKTGVKVGEPDVAQGERSKSRRGKQAGPGRPTIQDVAERAGVTKGTVSKYLNPSDGYYVSEATRARIEQAIEELDFRPSAIARGLTQNRTMTIGFVAADIRNPFYPDIVSGVQSVVEPEGYTVVLGSSGSDPNRERGILRSMMQRHVDGVILASARLQSSDLKSLIQSGMRVVLASRNLPELVTDTVVVDNEAGAKMMVEHLADLGHRRIGYIAGPQDVVPFQLRLQGYRSAMAEHGFDIDESLVVESESTTKAGAKAAQGILSRADRPTALFAANDNMALGAMDTAKRLGLRIPEDIAIVGFDNISLAANSFISLTTIDSEPRRIGEVAASVLLDRMKAGETPPYEEIHSIVHAPKLYVRSSSQADLS